MLWFLMVVIYSTPGNAVDWNGPWKATLGESNPGSYATEALCREAAIEQIGRVHQGMLAPIRFRCVSFDAALPVDAPR